MIRLICISSLFLSMLFVHGQNFDSLDCGFLKHLEKKKLYQEKFLYLQKTKIDTNFKNIEMAWVAYKLGYNAATHHFFANTPQSLMLASGYQSIELWTKVHLMTAKQQKVYFENTEFTDGKIGDLQKMFSLQNPKTILFDTFGLVIQKSYTKYYKIERKNTALATGLATVIPGLGKIYIGKSKDGLNALVLVSVFGVQAVESFVKSGPTNWRTLLFGTLAVSFHAGNIYGTVKSLKKSKKESRKEFLKSIDEEYLYHIGHYSICK